MSVIVMIRVTVDPAVWEEQVATQTEAIGRIIGIAKREGLIAHRWYGGDGAAIAIDEWPDAESFERFFEAAGPDIGPVMESAGVTSPPDVTVWHKLDTGDDVGWDA